MLTYNTNFNTGINNTNSTVTIDNSNILNSVNGVLSSGLGHSFIENSIQHILEL